MMQNAKLKIAIIDGPNLNFTGIREPHIYGNKNMKDYYLNLQSKNQDIELSYFQSNIEGELINYIQKTMHQVNSIIINAGAYTHTSIAIADALTMVQIPVIEVHMSNIFARENFRHVSYIGSKCLGCISGFGLESYGLALQYLTAIKQ